MAGYDSELARIVEQLNRSTPGGRAVERQGRAAAAAPSAAGSLEQLLAFAARQNASDLLLIAGSAVALRVNGALAPAAGPALSPEDVRGLVLPLLDVRAVRGAAARKVGGLLLRARARRAASAPTFTTSAARWRPASGCCRRASRRSNRCTCRRRWRSLAERRQGLVLVTGPTGCGKSSTLAALIDLINSRAPRPHRHHRGSRSSTSTRTAAPSWSRSKSGTTRRISRARCAASCGRRPT